MAHVIGWFARESDFDRSFAELSAAGFHPQTIHLTSGEQVVLDVLGRKPAQLVATYAAGGAFIGLAIYGTSALIANWCQCNLFHASQIIQIETIVGGFLAGMFVGGALGVFAGIGKLQELTEVFRLKNYRSGKVMEIPVGSLLATHVQELIQKGGADAVEIF